MKRIKVRIAREHLAYISVPLLEKFIAVTGREDYMNWIMERLYGAFGIVPKNREDIRTLQIMVEKLYYDSIGEWLQDEMRKIVKKC